MGKAGDSIRVMNTQYAVLMFNLTYYTPKNNIVKRLQVLC